MTNTPSQCGCKIMPMAMTTPRTVDNPNQYGIQYCELHFLAPRMFEFIEEVSIAYEEKDDAIKHVLELLRKEALQIIAKVEAKEKKSRCYLCGNNTVVNYECQECGATIKKG